MALTRLLWRACSRVALKRKQRQGTPASWAHLMYLWEPVRGQAGQGPWTHPRVASHGILVPGPARGVWVCVVNHHPFPLLQSSFTHGHTPLPGAQRVLGDTQR